MKHSLKTRMLSLLLAVIMLFGMLPAAYAAEEDPAEEQEIVEEAPVAEEAAPEEETAPMEEAAIEEEPAEAPAEDEEEAPVEEPAAEEEVAPEAAAVPEEPTGTPVTFMMGSAFSIAVAGGEYQAAAEAEIGYELTVYLEAGSYEVSMRAEGYKDAALTVEVAEEPQTVALVPETYEGGIQGMADSYELTEQDLNGIAFIEEYNYLSTMLTMEPEKDYEDGKVMFLADSEEEALAVAAAYGAELYSFQEGVAVLKLGEELSVMEAVQACSDPGNRLPFVEPVTKVSLKPVKSGSEERNREDEVSTKGLTSPYNWKFVIEILLGKGGFTPDPAIKNGKSSNYQYYHDVMNTYEAWGVTPHECVKVAVIDSGVYASHEDLTDNLKATGYYYDTDYNITGPTDEEGHGTHCIGIIGAALGNGAGGVGVNPLAWLYSYRALNNNGSGSKAATVAGINWAITQGVDVISLSMGSHQPNAAEEEAIRNAIDAGIVVVVAAGNDGSNIKNYPAAYNIPGMITVGALDRSKVRASYSNYGSWVDVYAPGSGIYSTDNGSANSYEFLSGTSMATPAVAGAVSLYIECLKFAGKTVSPKAVEAAVKKSVTDGSLDCMKLVSKGYTAAGIKVKALSNGRDYTERYPCGATIPSNMTLKLDDSALGAGETIYYTLDGSEPMFLFSEPVNGIAYDGKGISLADYAVGQEVTITAVACAENGEKGTVTKTTYRVGEAANLSAIRITAPAAITSGEKVDLFAKDYFGTDITGKVTWAVTLADGTLSDKVTITKDGVVCADIAEDCAILVTAISEDGASSSQLIQVNTAGGAAAAQNVTIKKITGVEIREQNSIGITEGVACTYNKNGTLKSVTLYTVNVPDSKNIDETCAYVYAGLWYTGAQSANNFDVVWSSKNEYIAYPDIVGNQVIICANILTGKTGKTTITAMAQDGSKKKASVTVYVKAPLSYVDIKTSATPDPYYGDYFLTPGKSATHKAILGDTYGKPSGCKVYWDAVLLCYRVSDNAWSGQWTADYDRQYITISSSGKLTLGKKIKELPDFYNADYYWKVKVTCTVVSDNYWNATVKNKIEYYVAPQVARIVVETPNVTMSKNTSNYSDVLVYADGFTGAYPNFVYYGAFSVTSSKPDVCGAYYDGDYNYVRLQAGSKTGTAIITIKALDGSGKKCTIKVKVN